MAVVTPFAFEISGDMKSCMGINLKVLNCNYEIITGRKCNACGLSRSIISLYHGNLNKSRVYHPLGIVFLIIIIIELLLRITPLIFKSKYTIWFDVAQLTIIFAALFILLNV